MAEQIVGPVAELWRYPVKSMLGERCAALDIRSRGSVGDRAWALRELSTGRIASAKRFPQLLDFQARYLTEPASDTPGHIEITTPSGRTMHPDDADASAIVSGILGQAMRFENQPRRDEKTGIDRATVFGDVPVGTLKPEWTAETMPDYFELKEGSFFEIGVVYLLTSGSVDHLRCLQGGSARIDRRRFRPNIYIESGPQWRDFVEDSWLGGALEFGDALRLEGFQPTVWCVTATLAQQDLPRDLSVLRTTAQHHRGCLGVYASVSRPGAVRVGDPVLLQEQHTPAGSTV